MTYRVKVAKDLVLKIKNLCKEAFPRERYGILLGYWVPPCVEITDLWVPDEVRSTQTAIELDPLWYVEAEEYARDMEIELVGDFHSHVCTATDMEFGRIYDTSPSSCDLKQAWNRLQMIVLVRETARGLRASYDIWAPLDKVLVKEVECNRKSARR